MSYDQYKELTPGDLQQVFVKYGARTVMREAEGALIYGVPWGTAYILPKTATDYAQHTAQLVAKILEWYGPRAVYELWSCVEKREQEKEKRNKHVRELCDAVGYGDDQ